MARNPSGRPGLPAVCPVVYRLGKARGRERGGGKKGKERRKRKTCTRVLFVREERPPPMRRRKFMACLPVV